MGASVSFRCAGAALVVALFGPVSAKAADADTALSLPAVLRALTDWNGVRSQLERDGIKFTFIYYGDGFGNPTGGVKQGLGYDGRFSAILDADLEKLAGWSGAILHASGQQIHGTQFSAMNLDNLMTVSGIEAPVSTRLFNLWLDQKFGQFDLRVGQFTAAQEFLISENANLFVNSTFGWPLLSSQDLPSGGPNYPEATPGARLKFQPNEQLSLSVAVFDGNPAGPGTGNPIGRDPNGGAFRLRDPPFYIVELAYQHGPPEKGEAYENPNQEAMAVGGARQTRGSELPGTIKVGFWAHTGVFGDERYDTTNGLLAVTGGTPFVHQGDYALYAIVDQTLWYVPGGGDRGLSAFARAMLAPDDRNPIDLYADGGLTFKGPLALRPDDTLGIAIAFARVSPLLSAFDRDTAAVTGIPIPIRNYEATIEWTYQWQMATNWYVQPNLQYIIHPGGNIPNPTTPGSTSPIPNALVLGLRTMVKF